MSSLHWFRAARRLVGVSKQQELPYLDGFMEAEEGQPTNDYQLAAWIAPPICAAVGGFTFRMIFLHNSPIFIVGAAISCLIGALLWLIFYRVDASIPESRKNLRRQANLAGKRFRGINYLLGVEEALSPSVGDVVNAAAGIYLKHARPVRYFAKERETPLTKSQRAMEDAMARMLDLTVPETAAAQEIELSKGWAMGLLKEMRSLDMTIERQKQSPALNYDDPLFNLREARMELEMRESATQELDAR